MKRKNLVVGIAAGALLLLGAALLVWKLLPGEPPGRLLYKKLLPTWQVARFRPVPTRNGAPAELKETTALLAGATRWPALRTALTELDRAAVERNDEAFRKAAESANRAAREAGLPYFLDTQVIREQPVALSYEVAERIGWQVREANVPDRSIEVLRLRRLDALNIEVAALGETQGEVPRVLLDRIEAQLARDLPLMFESADARRPELALGRGAAQPNGLALAIDRSALARQRSYLEERVGAAPLAEAVTKLARRDKLVEEMRTRFHSGKVELSRPDGFVLGEEWLDSLEPYTKLGRPGGPLLLDTDLRNVSRADEELRSGPIHETLARAVDLVALATEAHELQHSLDVAPPPPPPALVALFPAGDGRFPRLSNLELRAYLAELQHAAIPPCLTISKLVRNVYGSTARRTPHFFASYVILRKLLDEVERAPSGDGNGNNGDGGDGGDDNDAPPALDGGTILEKLCGSLPTPEAARPAAAEALRKRAATIYLDFYGAPFGERTRSPKKAAPR